MTGEPIALLVGGVVGLVLGSFAVTVGLRAARGEDVTRGRSHCDSCGQELSFADTAPLVSYVLACGRCRSCKGAISLAHPIGELLGAVVIVLSLGLGDLWRGTLAAACGLLLIAAAAVDVRACRLPDLLTGAIAIASALLAATSSPPTLLVGVVTAAACAMVLQALRLMRMAMKRDPGLGLGDVKLFAALALWLGPATPFMVALAAMLGLLWGIGKQGRESQRIPFGPAIAVSGWVLGYMLEARLWPRLG